MPKPCIAEIEGRVGGGGSELCLNFDMRFGVVGKYSPRGKYINAPQPTSFPLLRVDQAPACIAEYIHQHINRIWVYF